jgi:hypothetical protein
MDGSRLGVYAALGASVGAVPLPWIPDRLARRVRGALVHDVAARHGLALTTSARDLLADPAAPDERSGVLARAARYVGMRMALRVLTRVGPFGMLWPLRRAVQTYALGHLFDRYLARGRAMYEGPIDAGEARRVRDAVDGALVHALGVSAPAGVEPADVDDGRDAMTALVDGVLVVVAGVPARLGARLDAAFDDLLARSDG